MTAPPAFGSSEPHEQLSHVRELTRQVRHSQRATWFPLLVFALVTFVAIPVSRAGHPVRDSCRTLGGPSPALPLQVCAAHNSAAFVYWPIALVLAYVAIAAFYVHRAGLRGVGSRVRTYVVAGVVITVVVTAASIWAEHNPPAGAHDLLGWHAQEVDLYRLVGPASAIGFALLVLAAVERSLALLAVSIGYLVIALVPVDFGWTVQQPSRWAFVPHLVIDGSVLLAAGIAFALVQRPIRSVPA